MERTILGNFFPSKMVVGNRIVNYFIIFKTHFQYKTKREGCGERKKVLDEDRDESSC